MLQIWLRCDIRSPPFGTSNRDLCRVAIDQSAWADRIGFDSIQLPEHHGMPDGYNPSPFILGAAIAARTSRIRIHPSAVLLPLHDPIRIAEDTVVLDNISGGRVDLTIGLGYIQSEFSMFGTSLKDRGRLVDEKMIALRRALAGDKFEYQGRPVRVTPRPVQQPTPPLYVGGGVLASARRAAALGDGFLPSTLNDELVNAYTDACRELGKQPGPIIDVVGGPQFIFVTEDPDAGWAKIERHAMYETNSYAKLLSLGHASAPFKEAENIDELKNLGVYRVVTPDECVALGKSLESQGTVMIMNAMMAGLPEAISWSSLELFATKVLPRLRLPL
jgi:alkanesulfonate monooxygenase SsuD/methylene tetrahydromethanopterin reductase-like flavin-dependent oxidoreductase (luciferase family)